MSPKARSWLRFGLLLGVGALILAACTTPLHGECSGHVCVEWNSQPEQDIDKLNRIIEHGRREIGFALHGKAQIVFIEPNQQAMRGSRGRYEPDEDVIYQVYEPDLVWTHINHELLHRDLYLSTGDADGGHRDRRWARFCGGGNVACGTKDIR